MTPLTSLTEEAISLALPRTPGESPLLRSPLCYDEVIEALIEPLPSHLIKVRPGVMTKDKKRGRALAYYDWRVLVNRLNRLIGGNNWQVHLQPWGANKLICTLTILGVSKESTGEGEDDDENGGTSAEQQAKKRAMAEHGLNYLYLLPEVWGNYDPEKKGFVNPQALVEEMYANAHIDGLDLKPYISSARRRSPSPVSSSPPATLPPTAETTSSVTVDEKVIEGIKKLCERLGETEPDYTTLNEQSAQQTLTRLTNAYKATRARQKPVSAVSTK